MRNQALAIAIMALTQMSTAVPLLTPGHIWDTTLTPKDCQNETPFDAFMKCVLLNNKPCSRVTSFDGNDIMAAKVDFILPYEYSYGKRCIVTPRLSDMLDRRTRVKSITLSYAIVLDPDYDTVGFIKLPGIAGIRDDRGELYDWVCPYLLIDLHSDFFQSPIPVYTPLYYFQISIAFDTYYHSSPKECQGSEYCDRGFSFRLQMHNDLRVSLYYYPPSDVRDEFCENIGRFTDLRKVYTDACEPNMHFAHGFTIHSRPSNRIQPLGFVVKHAIRKNYITLKVSIDDDGILSVELLTRFDVQNGAEGRSKAKWFIGKDYSISSLYAWIAYGHLPERQPFNEQNQHMTISDWSLSFD